MNEPARRESTPANLEVRLRRLYDAVATNAGFIQYRKQIDP